MKLLFLRTVEDCSVSVPFLYFKKRPHFASFSAQTAAHTVSQHTVQTQTPETQMKDVRFWVLNVIKYYLIYKQILNSIKL